MQQPFIRSARRQTLLTLTRRLGRFAVAVTCLVGAPARAEQEFARLTSIAAEVTITRDDWGIAHVRAHTDAQAVFGMIYAQAEDDFGRIEVNYLTALGRLSEADGQAALMQDLRARLYVEPADLQQRYASSPAWLRALMDGWADGLNFYLATHPRTSPKVIRHFEPWMTLAFSEGSIGGDIERIGLPELARFYGGTKAAQADDPWRGSLEPAGSNGIALAPARTRDHHALLLINPHTSFYFRSELQVTSDEGLNAYGAATWGQLFLYQGFNARLGWMHTSTTADAVDSFAETVVEKNGALFTRYGTGLRPVAKAQITLSYRVHDGGMASKTFTALSTTHGPVVGRTSDGRWLSTAMMFKPVEALEQSFQLTKARDYAGFMQVMALRANTSNNTVYADADGTIAYLHPQFIPRRDDRFDYTRPVDGADPRTDWQGLHALDDLPHLRDPATGWIQNTNDWPYSAAGQASPSPKNFPRYMDTGGENMRGLHAAALLRGHGGFTLEALAAAAYDPALPGFARLIPHLLDAYDSAAPGPDKQRVAGQVALLRGWDQRWAAGSAATTLAIYWGEALWREAGLEPHGGSLADYDRVAAHTSPVQTLRALATASDRLTRDFGTWRIAWGEVNRFQRRTDDLVQPFSDAAPSLPVGFTSSQWGSLAAIGGEMPTGVRKRYGDDGNSFVAVVEFGDTVRALAVTAGGESGDRQSPHFNDQAARYAAGSLRPVYFYPADLAAHTERRYTPGAIPSEMAR